VFGCYLRIGFDRFRSAANKKGRDVGSKTTFIVLIHWTSILRQIRTINNFTGFKYFYEETAPAIYCQKEYQNRRAF